MTASIVGAACMLAPWAVAFIWNAEYADGRAAPMLPFFFVTSVFLCSVVSRWLLNNGYGSFVRFVLGASVLSGGIGLVLVFPAALIGVAVGMFSLGASLATATLFAVLLGASALPSAALWWVVAGRSHNKRLPPAARENARSN